RSAGDPAAPVAERIAADLCVLHDLRSAHHAGLAARPPSVRGRDRAAGTSPRVLLADAARALRGADRTLAAHAADRSTLSRRPVRLARRGPTRSPPMTDKTTRKTAARLKASVAILAIALQLTAQIGPAAAFCGFYVAQADAKLFNKSSKVVLV